MNSYVQMFFVLCINCIQL